MASLGLTNFITTTTKYLLRFLNKEKQKIFPSNYSQNYHLLPGEKFRVSSQKVTIISYSITTFLSSPGGRNVNQSRPEISKPQLIVLLLSSFNWSREHQSVANDGQIIGLSTKQFVILSHPHPSSFKNSSHLLNQIQFYLRFTQTDTSQCIVVLCLSDT